MCFYFFVLHWENGTKDPSWFHGKSWASFGSEFRLLGNSTYNATTAPIYKSLDLLNVKYISKKQTYIFMYKLHDNTLPRTLNDMFSPNYEIHQHHTRNRNNPHILHRRAAISEHSVLYSGPTLWQQLPPNYKQLNNSQLYQRNKETNYSKLLKYSHPQWAYFKTKLL